MTFYQQRLKKYFDTQDRTGQLSDFYIGATEFCQNVIAPHDRAMTQANSFHQPLWRKMGDAALLGTMMPKRYGGLGLDHRFFYAGVSAIAYASGSAALNIVAHSDLCAGRVNRNGDPDQKEQYLPDLISGKKVGSLAMSETGAGSDVMAMKTYATQIDSKHFSIDGTKMWITNAPTAEIFVVHTGTGANGTDKLTSFIVERDTKNFEIGEKLDKNGMRGSETAPLYFNDTIVSKKQILGKHNEGTSVLFPGLWEERLALAAIGDGLCRRALDEARDYTIERKQFGKELYKNQGVSFPIVDGDTELDALQFMIMNGANLASSKNKKLKNENWTAAASSKIFIKSSTITNAITLECMIACGGMGYTHDMGIGRAHDDGILLSIGGGAVGIQKIIVARDIFPK